MTCFSSSTILPVLVKGKLRLVEIGPIIDDILNGKLDIKDVAVIGVDESLKAVFNPIKQAYRLKSPTRMYKIRLGTGREFTVTGDHICYVLKDGKLKEKRADSLQEGDLLPFLLKMPEIDSKNDIDAIQRLLDSKKTENLDNWRVRGEKISDLILKNELSIKQQMRGHHNRTAFRNWLLDSYIPLRYFSLLKMPKEDWKVLEIGRGRRKGGKINWIPAFYQVDGDLSFLLGYFIGDGSARQSFLRLSVHSDDVDLVTWFKRFGTERLGLDISVRKEPNTNMFTLQFNSIGFIQILEEVLGVAKTSKEGKLKVPEVILNGSNEAIIGFLGGIIASDGDIHPNRNIIRITSASYKFIQELCYLTNRIGLYTTIQRHTNENNSSNPMYSLNVSGTKALNLMMSSNYLKSIDRKKILEKEQKLRSRAKGEDFPIIESNLLSLAQTARTSRNPRLTGKNQTSRENVRLQVEKITKQKEKLSCDQLKQLEQVEYLVNGDLGFANVTSIEIVPAKEESVYCFEVSKYYPGFVAGAGGTFTHNCFGYLGYRNARWGRIDAHETINAYARDKILRVVDLAEENELELAAGIVDSLWMKHPNEDPIEVFLPEFITMKGAELTNLPISVEGVYKWIVFLPRLDEPEVGVLNRYYGVFQDGSMKIRGIEIRKRDTPQFIKNAQIDVLELFAKADNRADFKWLVKYSLPKVYDTWKQKLLDQEIPLEDLIVNKVLSKNPEEYRANNHSALVSKQLAKEGVHLQSGMKVQFIVTDHTNTKPHFRVRPLQTIDPNIYQEEVDIKWYSKKLDEAFKNIIPPEYYTRNQITSKTKSLMKYL
ncbi:MAG: LAGLIDADG family homing endonuclease [Candidatus Hodarchaeales archaeon]